jgi:hypothetical protein
MSELIMKAFWYIIRIFPVIALILLIIASLLVFSSSLQVKEMDRLNVELAENLFGSKLTESRTIFDSEMLDQYIEKNTEPFVRYCEYGYRVTIRDLLFSKKAECADNFQCEELCIDMGVGQLSEDTCRCVKGYCMWYTDDKWNTYVWEFGYGIGSYENIEGVGSYENVADIQVTDPSVKEYEVGIRYPDGHVNPGLMTLTILDTWLTRITCAMENAYRYKEVQNVRIPCITEFGTTECYLPIRRNEINEQYVCIEDDTNSWVCRDMSVLGNVQIEPFTSTFTGKERFIRVMPCEKVGDQYVCPIQNRDNDVALLQLRLGYLKSEAVCGNSILEYPEMCDIGITEYRPEEDCPPQEGCDVSCTSDCKCQYSNCEVQQYCCCEDYCGYTAHCETFDMPCYQIPANFRACGNEYCAETHRECRNRLCEEVPGPGEDQCTQHWECR